MISRLKRIAPGLLQLLIVISFLYLFIITFLLAYSGIALYTEETGNFNSHSQTIAKFHWNALFVSLLLPGLAYVFYWFAIRLALWIIDGFNSPHLK